MSNKAEALALLALDRLTWQQEDRLIELTFMQAGYSVVIAPDNGHRSYQEGYIYALRYPDGRLGVMRHKYEAGVLTGEAPDYLRGEAAVGHCLTLPLPNNHWWELSSATSEVLRGEKQPGPGSNRAQIKYAGTPVRTAYGLSLPAAMLLCWWTFQEGS